MLKNEILTVARVASLTLYNLYNMVKRDLNNADWHKIIVIEYYKKTIKTSIFKLHTKSYIYVLCSIVVLLSY